LAFNAAAAISGSARCAQSRERQAVLAGVTRRNVAFHIDGIGAGGRTQRRLGFAAEHNLLDADENAPHDAVLAFRQTVQSLAQTDRRDPPVFRGNDLGGDDDVTRTQRRAQPAGHTERDDPANTRRVERHHHLAKLNRIAGAANHRQPGASGNPGFLLQSGDDQNRLFGLLLCGVFAGGLDHIPAPTNRLLLLRKFLYLAAAHKGKNLEYP
jgi:hypothetical protein